MKKVRQRLTYANVMSSIAVFLVLGGGAAFAANQLGRNSVGSKQIKKNAVTAAKIKKNAVTTAKIKKNAVTTAKIKDEAVTGAKVNEATLGTVPSATIASSLTPMEAVHLVGNPGEPGFENGAGNVPSEAGLSFNPVGFYKDHDGIVHLQGVAKGASGSVPALFTLPPGFRPASGKIIIQQPFEETTVIIAGSNVNTSGIDISGKVLSTPEEAILLDGISFRAEG